MKSGALVDINREIEEAISAQSDWIKGCPDKIKDFYLESKADNSSTVASVPVESASTAPSTSVNETLTVVPQADQASTADAAKMSDFEELQKKFNDLEIELKNETKWFESTIKQKTMIMQSQGKELRRLNAERTSWRYEKQRNEATMRALRADADLLRKERAESKLVDPTASDGLPAVNVKAVEADSNDLLNF